MEDVVSPWRGRRVYLTGHTGFKGSWLALMLALKGAVVRGYALDPSTEPNLFSAASVSTEIEDARGDICDSQMLKASIAEFAPEVIFHLAAQPLVRRSYADPLGTYATNVMGTAYVLEAVRTTPSVRAVICITTDKCYQNLETGQSYSESDPLGGRDPYSSSKACAEMVAAAYRDSFFPVSRLGEHNVIVSTARAGNVIGGGDWSEDRLIPDLIRGFHAGKSVLIRYPHAIRPWQHVLDPLHGYILLAERALARHEWAASSFNFGPSDVDAWPVERLATKLAEMWGGSASWTRDVAPAVHEARTLNLDSSKARATLGWTPRLNIERALEWTTEWYRAWQQGGDLARETRAQITAYDEIEETHTT